MTAPNVEYVKDLSIIRFLICFRVKIYHKFPTIELTNKAFEILSEFRPNILRILEIKNRLIKKKLILS